MFYYNWSDVSSKASISQAKDKKRLVYDVEGKAFNLTELKKAGNCSPVPDVSTLEQFRSKEANRAA